MIMMKKSFTGIKLCFTSVMLAGILFIMGCGGSKPSRFYTLSPVRGVTGNSNTNPTLDRIAIGIRTLKLPEYLLRDQLISRSENNRIVLSEFDRWAEPLEANFKRVLVEDLSQDIPTNKIFLFPAKDTSVTNYQLLLEVTEFEMRENNTVVLSARWGLEKGEDIVFLMNKRSSFSEQISGSLHEDIVAAMSRLTGKLSNEIAAEVRSRVLAGN